MTSGGRPFGGTLLHDVAAELPMPFVAAHTFDSVRNPYPHLGFGQRVHYRLGTDLARLELCVLFEELLGGFSSARLVKAPEWTRGNRHTGIRQLVVQLR